MKKINLLLSLIFVLSLIGCTDNISTVGEENIKTDVILSSSFEDTQGASFGGWTTTGAPYVKLANESPAGGGNYSIFLKAKSMGAEAYNVVTPIAGTHKYLLSFWSKITEDPGYIEIYLRRGTNILSNKALTPNSKVWKKYTIETELTAAAGDKIEIKLNGSEYKIPQGFTYFDLITLERLD